LQEITQVFSLILNLERASIWFYNQNNSASFCANLYELTPNQHSQGYELSFSDYPKYFQALESEKCMVVYDAKQDPKTTEFTETYLTPLLISSMLDVPIHLKGEIKGVICI